MSDEEPLLAMVAASLVEETRVSLVRAALAHLGAKEMHRHAFNEDVVRRELRTLLTEAADRVYDRHREAVIDRVVDEILEGAMRGQV